MKGSASIHNQYHADNGFVQLTLSTIELIKPHSASIHEYPDFQFISLSLLLRCFRIEIKCTSFHNIDFHLHLKSDYKIVNVNNKFNKIFVRLHKTIKSSILMKISHTQKTYDCNLKTLKCHLIPL